MFFCLFTKLLHNLPNNMGIGLCRITATYTFSQFFAINNDNPIICFLAMPLYRSKGLLTHLIKRKHFSAAKYIDSLSEIITEPDYAGYTEGTLGFNHI